MILRLPINKGWMPDLVSNDIAKAGGLVTAKNIIPVSGNYLPVLGKSTFNSTALSGTPVGGCTIQDTDGGYVNFAGTSTKLYRFTKGSLTDITRVSGGAYASVSWQFEEYGSWLLATDGVDEVQVLKGLTAANFQALGGSPPEKAKYFLVNNGYLVLAHITESTILSPKKIRWSGLENIETWTIDPAGTGADSQDFPDMKGIITGIGSIGDNFVIASEYSLTLGSYTGGAFIFQFQPNYVKNIGCFYPKSFISVGNGLFFWGRDSIYMVDNTGAPHDIGGSIKKTLFSDINIEYAHLISVSHDPTNGLIMWGYPRVSSTTPNRILVYSYKEDRFTYIDLDSYCLWVGSVGSISIDELTTSIDELNIPIDSNYWLNNQLQPFLVDTSDSKIKTLTGSALTTEIETGEVYENPKVLMARKVYTPVELLTGSGTVTIKHRYSALDSQTSATATAIKSDGYTDVRSTNRRLAVNLTASGYSKLGNVIEIDAVESGSR